jgi:hypothetical protein
MPAYTKEDSTRHSPREPKEKKAPKQIPKKSAKRKVADVEYKKLNQQFLKDNPMCAIYPSKMAIEVHHRHCGKDRDKYYLDTTTWLPVSREGHNYIHSNPLEAREKGWLF